MTRFFIRPIILALLAAGGLASGAAAQGGQPPRGAGPSIPAGPQPGTGGQPGQYIGGTDDGSSILRDTNNRPARAQDATGLRPGKPGGGRSATGFGDEPGLNGGDMMQIAPTTRPTEIHGDGYERTRIRSRQPRRSTQGQVRRRSRER